MEKSITIHLNPEELKTLITDAVQKATKQLSGNNSKNDIAEDYLDQREAAKFLRISFPTIIRWKKEKKIPYYQEGRKVLFKKSELLQVLSKNQSLLK
ncbi:MAG TPA: helix-turn-helix domain-containing protein [Bacteroidales bacterium]